MNALLSILGTGLLCASWVLVQRWIARHDPGQPGVNGKCHSCGPKDARSGAEVAAADLVGTPAQSQSRRFSV